MRKTEVYQIRLDSQEKKQAFAVFKQLGITPAQAVRLFFKQVVITKSIPFSIENQNINLEQLIRLRKTLPVLSGGDYQDLLPEHPQLWCYTRTADGKTLRVMANLSAQDQAFTLPEFPGSTLLSNYASPAVSGMLRPYECLWQLTE